MLTKYLTFAAAFGLVCATAPAFAQPLHQHQHQHQQQQLTPWHHNHVIVDPHGLHVTTHHDDYHYVIPSQSQNLGTYYTHNDQHYF